MPCSSSKLILNWLIRLIYIVLLVSVVEVPLGSEDAKV